MSYLPYSKLENASDVQKKYTRIALLRMKEELNDLTMTDSHHAHEFFVVNSFKMFYSLEMPPSTSSASSNDTVDFKDHTVPARFLPLKIETVNNFLSEVNRFAVFPKSDISYADYKVEATTKKLELGIDWKHADAVYKFVRERKDIGACSQELLVICSNALNFFKHFLFIVFSIYLTFGACGIISSFLIRFKNCFASLSLCRITFSASKEPNCTTSSHI